MPAARQGGRSSLDFLRIDRADLADIASRGEARLRVGNSVGAALSEAALGARRRSTSTD